MDEFDDLDTPKSAPKRPSPTIWVLAGLMILIGAGVIALQLLKPSPPPVPKELAGDPLLSRGHGIFAMHCVVCHGESGRGDGPNARELKGPSPGNLTDPSTWKHGRSPDRVEAVIASGVGDAAMPGWEGVLGPDGVRAASAYVFHLAKMPVPDAWRAP